MYLYLKNVHHLLLHTVAMVSKMATNNVMEVSHVTVTVPTKHHDEVVELLPILKMSVQMEIIHQVIMTNLVARRQNMMLLLYQNLLVKHVSTLMNNT